MRASLQSQRSSPLRNSFCHDALTISLVKQTRSKNVVIYHRGERRESENLSIGILVSIFSLVFKTSFFPPPCLCVSVVFIYFLVPASAFSVCSAVKFKVIAISELTKINYRRRFTQMIMINKVKRKFSKSL